MSFLILPLSPLFNNYVLRPQYKSTIILENDEKCLVTQLCPTLCNAVNYSPPGFSVRGDSPGKDTGVGCHALLQGIFPTQGSNPGLPHCRQILYHLSHWGSPENDEISLSFSNSYCIEERLETKLLLKKKCYNMNIVQNSMRSWGICHVYSREWSWKGIETLMQSIT